MFQKQPLSRNSKCSLREREYKWAGSVNGGRKRKARLSALWGSLLWQLVLSPTRTSACRMPVRIVQTLPLPPGSKWTTLTYVSCCLGCPLGHNYAPPSRLLLHVCHVRTSHIHNSVGAQGRAWRIWAHAWGQSCLWNMMGALPGLPISHSWDLGEAKKVQKEPRAVCS